MLSVLYFRLQSALQQWFASLVPERSWLDFFKSASSRCSYIGWRL